MPIHSHPDDPEHPRVSLGTRLRNLFREPTYPSRKIAVRSAFISLLVASAVFGVMLGLVLVYSVNLPQMDDLARYRPSTTTDLYDIHGKIFGSFSLERRIVVPYEEFPENLKQAIYSIEDKNFETNGGINIVRAIGAAYHDIHSHGRAQGASTLTMQLSRNLFLSAEKTYGRKLQEILLTLQIERRFTKPQIFALYANQIYLGRGTYGFEAGSQYYFSKHVHDLTLSEAALLAALPKGPESYSPVRHPERALKRRNLVLSEMLADKKINEQQYEAAKAEPLGLNIEKPANTEAPYFIEEVRRQLEREYGVETAHGAGLQVYTTLDLDLQRTANKAVLDNLAAYERRHGWKGKIQNILSSGQNLNDYQHPDWNGSLFEGQYLHALVLEASTAKIVVKLGSQQATLTYPDWAWTQRTKGTDLAKPGDILYVKVITPATPKVILEQDSGAQASLMAVDNANGEVIAMVGGRDYALSQFNRATQAQRQVGSSFKPYVYTTAIEAGETPSSIVVDAPTSFYTPNGPYTPHNYEVGSWKGNMTLTEAFAESRNIPALRLANKYGIKKVIETARRFGVTSPMPNFLPVAIGAADITLAEQVGAYSVFPNDGIRIQPHYIRKVVQTDGLQVQEPTPEVREVISVDTARQMMILLQAVTSHGTAAQASQLKHAFGGKTGTTNNYTDAWFLGFSPSVTCGTWIGFDTRESLGEKETGAKAALPIWMDFMKAAIAGKPDETFARPNAPKKKLEVTPVDNEDALPKSPKPDDSDSPDDNDDQPAAPATPAPSPQPAPQPAMPDTLPDDSAAPIFRQPASRSKQAPASTGTPRPQQ